MANITAADLLVGSDEDFVINLYLALLGRWPDPVGFAHMVAKVAGSEEARMQAITDMMVSPETLARGRPLFVQDPLVPSEPVAALQRQLALRTEFLRGLVETLQGTQPSATTGTEPLLAEARADMAALRREMREGMAKLHDTETLRREPREHHTGGSADTQPGPGFADYVNDLLAVAEARMETRLRALEKRLP